MPKIIEIPGRSGFYLRVAVPRGKLRDAFGTCDVVKKIGNTKEEAEENISSAEIAIQQKFDEKLRDCLLYTSPSPRDRTRSRMPSSA